MNIGRITVILDASLWKFEKNLKKASHHIHSFSSRLNKLSSGMNRLGYGLTWRVSLPIVGFFANGIKELSNFEKASAHAMTVFINKGPKVQKQMEDMATLMSEKYPYAASKIMDAFFFLGSSGLSASQSMELLESSLKFATAGMFSLNDAIRMGTDVQHAMGLASEDPIQNMKNFVYVTDNLAKANTLAKASVKEFAQALANRSAAGLRVFNKSLEEGISLLGVLANQSIRGLKAGLQTSIFLRYITYAWTRNKEEFKKFGIEIFDTNKEMRGFADIVSDIETKLGRMPTEDIIKSFEEMGIQARALHVFLMLKGFSKDMRKFQLSLQDLAGTTGRMSDVVLRSFWAELQTTRNVWNNFTRDLSDSLKPVLVKVFDRFKEFAKWFHKLPSSTKTFVAVLMILAAVLGPIILVLGLLVQVFASVFVAISIAIGVIGSFVGFIIMLPIHLASLAASIVSSITSVAVFGAALGGIIILMFGLTAIFPLLSALFKGFSVVLGRTSEKIKSELPSSFEELLGVLFNFSENWNRISTWISKSFTLLARGIVDIISGMIKQMKTEFSGFGKYFYDYFRTLLDPLQGLRHGVLALIEAFSALHATSLKDTLAHLKKSLQYAQAMNFGSFNSPEDQVKRNQAGKGQFLKGIFTFAKGMKVLSGGFPELKKTIDGKNAYAGIGDVIGEKINQMFPQVNVGLPDGGLNEEFLRRDLTAGALERGTSEAFSAAYKGRNLEQDIEKNTKDTATETKKQSDILEGLSDILSPLGDLQVVDIESGG